MLDYWYRELNKIREDVESSTGARFEELNFSVWKEWAAHEKILWQLNLESGKVEEV